MNYTTCCQSSNIQLTMKNLGDGIVPSVLVLTRETQLVLCSNITWKDICDIECGYDLNQYHLSFTTENSSQIFPVIIIKDEWLAAALSMVGSNAFYQVFLVNMWYYKSRDVKFPHNSRNGMSRLSGTYYHALI